MIVKLLTEHHLEFLKLKGGCTGSPEFTFVKMPHCRRSHVAAQHYVDFRSVTDGCEGEGHQIKVCTIKVGIIIHCMSLVARKPVYGVSDQVRLKPTCSATETS